MHLLSVNTEEAP